MRNKRHVMIFRSEQEHLDRINADLEQRLWSILDMTERFLPSTDVLDVCELVPYVESRDSDNVPDVLFNDENYYGFEIN